MSILEAKLSELRLSSERFLRSSEQIRQSVTTTQEIIDGLFALGYESPGAIQFMMHYNTQRAAMNDWAGTLAQFARVLGGTAEDLERLNRERSERPFHLRRTHREFGSTEIAAAGVMAAAPLAAGYVSQANLAVQGQLWDARTQLIDQRAHLAALNEQRAAQAEALEMLRGRIVAHDATANPDSVMRVQAMNAELAALDAQIAEQEADVAALELRVSDLETRLERVEPAPGANPQAIIALEGGQTNPWVQANTQDCVQHIAVRMPIPDALAGDAHLWNDLARQHPEYGISRGDTPLAGSVIVMEREHSYASDDYGHLLYVERVDVNGGVWVTDNHHPEPVLLSALTDEVSGANLHYLYFPWHTRA